MDDDMMVGVVRRGILCRGEWPLTDEQFWNSPRLWFAPLFLLNPDKEWRVAWNKQGRANPDKEWWLEPGTIIKHDDPHRVWQLTGEVDQSTRYLEGVWPD